MVIDVIMDKGRMMPQCLWSKQISREGKRKKMSCVTRSPIFQYANIFLYLCTTVKIFFSPINLCFAFLDQMVLHKKMLAYKSYEYICFNPNDYFPCRRWTRNNGFGSKFT